MSIIMRENYGFYFGKNIFHFHLSFLVWSKYKSQEMLKLNIFLTERKRKITNFTVYAAIEREMMPKLKKKWKKKRMSNITEKRYG